MKSMKQVISTTARLAVAAIVMTWLLRKMGVATLGQTLRSCADQWYWLAAALVVTLVPVLLCMIRWKLILDAQGLRLSWFRTNSIFFIGLFFNAFMIGPTGGDIIKAYLTARETHQKKTEAISTILIDRVIGMLMLALMTGGMILIRWDFLMEHSETRRVAIPMLAVCTALVAGGILAFSVHLFDAIPFLKRMTTHRWVGRIASLVERVYNAFYVCRKHPRLLLQITLASLTLQTCLVAVAALVGKAMGLNVRFIDYLTFYPLVSMIGAIPVTPGGLGLREGASIHMWSVLAVSADKAFLLAFMPYLFLTAWGIPGGILFLFHRSANPIPPAEALASDQE